MRHARKDYQERIIDAAEKLRAEGVPFIPEDEPVFLLRAKDVTAPSVVRHWAMLAEQAGADDRIVKAALAQAQAMSDWQKEHGCHVPDMPEDA